MKKKILIAVVVIVVVVAIICLLNPEAFMEGWQRAEAVSTGN